MNFREREMNPDRSFSLAIVVFCNLPLILLSADGLSRCLVRKARSIGIGPVLQAIV